MLGFDLQTAELQKVSDKILRDWKEQQKQLGHCIWCGEDAEKKLFCHEHSQQRKEHRAKVNNTYPRVIRSHCSECGVPITPFCQAHEGSKVFYKKVAKVKLPQTPKPDYREMPLFVNYRNERLEYYRSLLKKQKEERKYETLSVIPTLSF